MFSLQPLIMIRFNRLKTTAFFILPFIVGINTAINDQKTFFAPGSKEAMSCDIFAQPKVDTKIKFSEMCWLLNGHVSIDGIFFSNPNDTTKTGAIWQRTPFTVTGVSPFQPEVTWAIEVVFKFSPAKRSSGKGEQIAFWLAANESVSDKPNKENLGIDRAKFTGLGIILHKKRSVLQVTTVFGEEIDIQSNEKQQCLSHSWPDLETIFLLIKILKKSEKEIVINLKVSSLQQFCNFSVLIPKKVVHSLNPSKSILDNWLYFGVSAFSSQRSNYSLHRLLFSEFQIKTTTIVTTTVATTRAQTTKKRLLSPPWSKAAKICGDVGWPKKEKCWLQMGDAFLNKSVAILTGISAGDQKASGSLWQRNPFFKDDLGPFSPGAIWTVDIVFSIKPSPKSRSLGSGIAFYLISNETVSESPALANFGVQQNDFTGFGLILEIRNRGYPRIISFLGKNEEIATRRQKTKCRIAKKRSDFADQRLFLSIDKDEDKEIQIELLNSTLHRICEFSIRIPSNLMNSTKDQKSVLNDWLYFGSAAFTDHGTVYEIHEIASDFDEQPKRSSQHISTSLMAETTPGFLATSTNQSITAANVTEPEEVVSSVLSIILVVVIVLILVSSTVGVIVCVCLRKTRSRKNRRPQPITLRPPTLGFSPSPRLTQKSSTVPIEDQQLLQRAGSNSYVQEESPEPQPQPDPQDHLGRHDISPITPYITVNFDDVPLSATYLRPDTSISAETINDDTEQTSASVVVINDIADQLDFDESLLLDPSRIRFISIIGTGAFGVVQKAELTKPDVTGTKELVAIKKLKNPNDPMQHNSLECELKLLAHIGCHQHVIQLLGAVKTGQEFFMVLEFCDGGSLKHFLHDNRSKFLADDGKIAENGQFNRHRLVSLAKQISNGMAFIHSRRCIHRDLAARNILLCQNQNVAKITDFGLAKDIYADGIYQSVGKNRIPWPWYAPEYLKDFIYVFRSDIWSYGVLLWEILSLGQRPYTATDFDPAFLRELELGKRLERPLGADDDLYDLMLSCWQWQPEYRPSFKKIDQELREWLVK